MVQADASSSERAEEQRREQSENQAVHGVLVAGFHSLSFLEEDREGGRRRSADLRQILHAARR